MLVGENPYDPHWLSWTSCPKELVSPMDIGQELAKHMELPRGHCSSGEILCTIATQSFGMKSAHTPAKLKVADLGLYQEVQHSPGGQSAGAGPLSQISRTRAHVWVLKVGLISPTLRRRGNFEKLISMHACIYAWLPQPPCRHCNDRCHTSELYYSLQRE